MLDRTAATRWTRLAQVGAVSALALSAAAVVVSLPGQKPELPPEQAVITVPPAPAEDPRVTAAEKPDTVAAGKRMGIMKGHPTPAVTIPVQPPPDAGTAPPVADITYHGIVTVGTRAMALLKQNGKQRFVKVGDKVGDEAVEEITAEHVRLGAAHLVPLADRSGSAVSRLQSVNPAFAQTASPRMDSPQVAAIKAAKAAAKLAMENGDAPAYVPPEEVPMWRRLRAQLVLSGEYKMQDNLDEIALKLLGERRDELKANPQMTVEEQQAEAAYLDKAGRTPESRGEKQ